MRAVGRDVGMDKDALSRAANSSAVILGLEPRIHNVTIKRFQTWILASRARMTQSVE